MSADIRVYSAKVDARSDLPPARRTAARDPARGRGLLLPRWQVKQVTRGSPPKYALLIVFIIAIMPRARTILGVASANFARSKYAAFDVAEGAVVAHRAGEHAHRLEERVDGNALQHLTLLNTSSDMTGACGAFWCLRRLTPAAPDPSRRGREAHERNRRGA